MDSAAEEGEGEGDNDDGEGGSGSRGKREGGFRPSSAGSDQSVSKRKMRDAQVRGGNKNRHICRQFHAERCSVRRFFDERLDFCFLSPRESPANIWATLY